MDKSGGRRARRVFSDEFRAGAVRLVLEEGKSAGAVARDLDVTESDLRSWSSTTIGVGPRAPERMRENSDSPRARHWRRAASWMGRLNLFLALDVLAIAVALVRGGF